MLKSAIIRKLRIQRFRGLEDFSWNPEPGLNIILGGGDVGKTTILEAVALLLNPSSAITVSEADYWNRNIDAGFEIQAVVALSLSSEIAQQSKFLWPWQWNGQDAITPIVPEGDGDDIPSPSVPVYCIRVRGTPDMEVNWEVLQPNEEVDQLSAAMRRKIGVVRLSGDDRNDRDLRLVFGSALDRLLSDRGLKARIGKQVSEIDISETLDSDSRTALIALDQSLSDSSLPNNLALGLTSSQGLSIGALIGLFADNAKGVSMPLASWGAGTRRMATLRIAAATQAETRITIIDEIERGLEPYRVRKLVKSIQAEPTQSLVTTHSSVAISAANEGHLWYLDQAGAIGRLPSDKIARQQERDPETFLNRLAVVAEGPTEIGFVSYLLERAVAGDLLDHGVRVCDGQGNQATLGLLEGLTSSGLRFAGFVDFEGDSPDRWKRLKSTLGDLLFQWEGGCTEENIIKEIDESRLCELLLNEDGDIVHERLHTLAERLGIPGTNLDDIVNTAPDFRALIISASIGSAEGAPDNQVAKSWKKHGRKWFKSKAGGRELASKMFMLGAWPAVKSQILPFFNSVRNVIGQEPIVDVTHA